MAKYYYRGMRDDNGKPKLGRNARCLGIRPNIDIDLQNVLQGWVDKRGFLLPESKRRNIGMEVKVVIKNGKGMSLSLSVEGLPKFRKPPQFGGNGKDPIWEIDSHNLRGDLEAIEDGSSHVSLIPRRTMLLERYEQALARTQNDWIMVK